MFSTLAHRSLFTVNHPRVIFIRAGFLEPHSDRSIRCDAIPLPSANFGVVSAKTEKEFAWRVCQKVKNYVHFLQSRLATPRLALGKRNNIAVIACSAFAQSSGGQSKSFSALSLYTVFYFQTAFRVLPSQARVAETFLKTKASFTSSVVPVKLAPNL